MAGGARVNLGLAGSADRAGFGGAGTAHEFDATGEEPTWTPSAPSVSHDTDATVKSHLYLVNNDTTERLGYWAWAPGSGNCNVIAKINHGAFTTGTTTWSFGLVLMNSDNSARVLVELAVIIDATPTIEVRAFTYAAGAYTQRGLNHPVGSGPIYVRINQTAANTFAMYWSTDGIIWHLIQGVQALTMTIARVGFRLLGASGATHTMISDVLRTDV